jgi:2-polyprenyl-3-methyl-5-hydroxy-6-metoxy-1,4-benzoquinol methylase
MALRLRIPVDFRTGKKIGSGELYWCERCDFGALRPVPTPEEVAEFYLLESYYTHETTSRDDARPRHESLLDKIRVRIAHRSDRGAAFDGAYVHASLGGCSSTILDVGCGSGLLMRELRELGHQVLGVELDRNADARREEHGLTVYMGSAEDLPMEVQGRQFDCILMSHVLEHCRQPVRALQNLRELLRPGGILICEVPNNSAAGARMVGSAWAMFDAPRHLTFFTPASLTSIVVKAGLAFESLQYCHFVRQFTNDWIEGEQEIFDRLMSADEHPEPLPVRNSRWKAWKLLLETLRQGPEGRYDCVRVIARRVD